MTEQQSGLENSVAASQSKDRRSIPMPTRNFILKNFYMSLFPYGHNICK